MKMRYYQQVSVDLFNMVYTAIAYLALAGAAWLFLRLIQACFWLPNHMKRQNDVHRMLEDKVESYERYMKECEENEASGVKDENDDGVPLEQKKKEREECLNMLKRELKRIRDGGDPYDFNYILGDDEKKLLDDLDEEEEEEKRKKAEKEEEEEDELDVLSSDDQKVDSEPKKDK